MAMRTQGEIVDDVNALRAVLPGLVQYLMFEAAVDQRQERRITYLVRRATSGFVFTADFSQQPDWLLSMVKERKNKMPSVSLGNYQTFGWRQAVEVKDVLDLENNSLEKMYLHIVLRFEVENLILPDKFHDRAKQGIALDDVDIFDLALETMYSWADENRIWLGV